LRLVGQHHTPRCPISDGRHPERGANAGVPGENVVQHKPSGQSTDAAFKAFVDELAAGTTDLLVRMKLGHEPDEHGWCRHTTHEHHWESHPCSMLRLAQLAETDPVPPVR
jgi:hypothetical protein